MLSHIQRFYRKVNQIFVFLVVSPPPLLPVGEPTELDHHDLRCLPHFHFLSDISMFLALAAVELISACQPLFL